MKKGIFLTLSFVLLLLLSACRMENKKEEIVPTKMVHKADLSLVDIAKEFDFTKENLPIYSNEEDPQISYVNIVEFIELLEGGLVNLMVESTLDQLKVSYTFDVSEEYQDQVGGETYTYTLTFDPAEETVTYNDIDMIQSINSSTSEYESTRFLFKKVLYEEGNQEVTFPLKDYGMEIVYEKGNYYIPLYLTNLFLTGQYLHVYEMKDKIYIFDDSTELTKLIEKFEEDENLDAKNFGPETKQFLSLYFNYFYGLKSHKTVEDYGSLIESYSIEDSSSFALMNKRIDQFIIKLDDLHTSIISGGFMNDNYVRSRKMEDKTERYADAYVDNYCYDDRGGEIVTDVIDDTFVLKIKGFSLDTGKDLDFMMDYAKNFDNILIDLSCNGGGNIIGVIELLSYMTDEDIQLSYVNPLTGSKTTEVYEVTGPKFPKKNFYILTSRASYSAANLFASYVKDHNLGMLMGEPTSGGASAIQYMVLPNGAIITSSSLMTFVNTKGEIIEDGIIPPMQTKAPFNLDGVVSSFDKHLNFLASTNVKKQSTNDGIDYRIIVNPVTDKLQVLSYHIEVSDLRGNLLYLDDFTSNATSFQFDREDDHDHYEIKLFLTYEIHAVSQRQEIFTEIVLEPPLY